jgi:hypothetical protein
MTGGRPVQVEERVYRWRSRVRGVERIAQFDDGSSFGEREREQYASGSERERDESKRRLRKIKIKKDRW